MITAGLKLTRNGGIAVIRDDRLEFNVEVQQVADLNVLPRLLADQNYTLDEVAEWAVDGWDGAKSGLVQLTNDGASVEVTVAPYQDNDLVSDPAQPGQSGSLELGARSLTYASYVHVASLLAAAYSTSPFARRGEPATVLVWDDSCFPRLYRVDAGGRITPDGELFPVIGHAYAMAAERFGPQDRALGTVDGDVGTVLRELFDEHFAGDTPRAREYRQTITGCGATAEPSHRYVDAYLSAVHERTTRLGAADVDVLATLHDFIARLLLDRLGRKVRAHNGGEPVNLCFAGSAALDIRWNSALREHPAVREMWVSPFPDGSGAAVGAAALHLGRLDGLRALDWSGGLGPDLVRHAHLPAGWVVSPCRPEELARFLHRSGKPAVVLYGRAGLGSRGILAPAVDPGMPELLNGISEREAHQPVGAICPTDRAGDVFDPGTPDPHRQFEHRVRPDWVDRVPAIGHLDGTTAVQTVRAEDDPTLTAILREYHKWSGIPVLCGVSMHFPDAVSAMRWGAIDTIWGDGILHRRVRGGEDKEPNR